MPYLSALENDIVFKAALQMSGFTLVTFILYWQHDMTIAHTAAPMLLRNILSITTTSFRMY